MEFPPPVIRFDNGFPGTRWKYVFMNTLIVRRILAIAGTVVLSSLLLGAANVSYLAVYLNPGDTVSVHLTGTTLSSATSGAGDTFQVVAAGPTLTQGNVVIISGAPGQGHVVSVKPAKGGKPAALAVQIDWIIAVDGQQIPLTATKKGDPLIFGAGGPYEKSFAKDKPVTVGPDFTITAFVSQQKYIQVNPQ
jgi:hypothetical protein